MDQDALQLTNLYQKPNLISCFQTIQTRAPVKKNKKTKKTFRNTLCVAQAFIFIFYNT